MILQGESDERQWSGAEVAVVGLSGRFPGAGTLDEFWSNLRGGVESVTFFTDEEVRMGVDFISKTAPGRYATADAIADEAVSMALDGRTTEFTTSNLHDLATVTSERVDAAWARFASEAGIGTGSRGAGWTIVVVGDASAHAEQVEALGLGPVTVVRD